MSTRDELRALRDAIARKAVDFDTIRAALHGVPASDVAWSVTLSAAWGMVHDDPAQRVAALAHVARVSHSLSQAPAKAAKRISSSGGSAVAQAKWDAKFGPGFDLYREIELAAESLGLTFGWFPTECIGVDHEGEPVMGNDKLFAPTKEDQRAITRLLKALLIKRYPDRWSPDSKLYIDPKSFQLAFAGDSRIDPFAAMDPEAPGASLPLK